MWNKIASFILKNSIVLLLVLLISSIYMGYQGTKAKMSYNFSKIIPKTDSVYIENESFKKMFGEDGNTLVLGVQSKRVFDLDFFNDWRRLGETIKNIEIDFEGEKRRPIRDVLSVGHLPALVKDDSTDRFIVENIIPSMVTSQKELDALKEVIFSQKFYDGLIFNEESNVSVMHVTFDTDVLNSGARITVVNKIREISAKHMGKYEEEIHFSGLPFIRTVMATEVRDELILFIFYALGITALLLLIMFRSFFMVIFPMVVVVLGVMWSLGMVSILGFKITILTGLIPPLIVVIGIPNCIYLLNRFHTEFIKHGDKVHAWERVIEKVGVATFFTNLTTAVGFGVFFLTESNLLKEFGLVAGVSIMLTFLISLIFIPVIFKFLPDPTSVQTKYLKNQAMERFIGFVSKRALEGRKLVFAVTSVIVVFAVFGMIKMKAEGFIVDDLPHETKEYRDLMFFEEHFNGIMPFEVVISAKSGKKIRGSRQYKLIKKMDKGQKVMESFDEISRTLSVADGYKFINQAYHNGHTKFYKMPSKMDLSRIKKYVSSESDKASQKIIDAFIADSSRYYRIKGQVKDLGSIKLPVLRDSVKSALSKVFDPEIYDVRITGTSVVFIAGNSYLVKSLIQSLLLAFIIIALIMAFMFRSSKMLLVCLIPNTIPLIITAGIMGYFNIPLKPSTVLVFSVAYGIAVDTSIHFLAKFQQEIHRHEWDTAKTIKIALQETGRSMIYNSLILFGGFVIFVGSNFGGTVALGMLSSITLITAMFTNTILLPSLLMKVEGSIKEKGLKRAKKAALIKDEI